MYILWHTLLKFPLHNAVVEVMKQFTECKTITINKTSSRQNAEEKAKTWQWQSLSWSLFVLLFVIFNGNLKRVYFRWVDMSFFNRIRPDLGFVSPVRSDPGFVSPGFCESGPIRSRFCQSDPILSGPVRSGFCQRPRQPTETTVLVRIWR